MKTNPVSQQPAPVAPARRPPTARVVLLSAATIYGAVLVGQSTNSTVGAAPPLTTIVTPVPPDTTLPLPPTTTVAPPTTTNTTVPPLQPLPPERFEPQSSAFVQMTPCRIIDTRAGEFHVGNLDRLGPDSTNIVPVVAGTGSECEIPEEAAAVSLNVTALGASASTFLTMFPSDETRPNASSLNPVPGAPPTPNAVVVSLGELGEVAIYNAFGSVDVIIDINGIYTAEDLGQLGGELDALRSARPFVEFVEVPHKSVHEGSTLMAPMQLTFAGPGSLVIDASATTFTLVPDAYVECAISESTAMDPEAIFGWESSANTGVAEKASESGTIATTRVFDIERPGLQTINLICRRSHEGAISLLNLSLVATFFPDQPTAT